MCDCCGHRFYPPWTAIKGNTVSLILWPLNAVCYPPYVAACVRTCSDTRRSAADASAGPPGKYPSGRTWCPHRWRGPLQQQQKRKGKKIVKINFTSHTFKADLGELQFLSFFRVFYYFLFLCLAISGSPFNGPLRAYPGQKIMWTLAGVALPAVSDCLHWDFAYADGSWKFYSQFWERQTTLETRSCECLFWQQQQIICLVRFA